MDRDGTAFRTRLSLFWIRKVITFPLSSFHVIYVICRKQDG